MFAGLDIIRKDYERGNKEKLSFLVDIEQRIAKLFCYRFWVVNYLFADGVWHEYFVDNLKNLVRKFVDIDDGAEKYEQNVLKIQRDLLQTDYADLYLQQALNGVEMINLLLNNKYVKKDFSKIINNFASYQKKEADNLWKKIIDYIIDLDKRNTNKNSKEKLKQNERKMLQLLLLPINQIKMKNSNFPLIACLIHAVEFREENEELLERYESMKKRIRCHFNNAKKKLSVKDFSSLKLCYNQCRILSISKDAMGEIDPFLLPFWFDEVHQGIRNAIVSNYKKKHISMEMFGAHNTMFRDFVWYLPDKLKIKVLTPDNMQYKLNANKKNILKNSDMWNAWEHDRF